MVKCNFSGFAHFPTSLSIACKKRTEVYTELFCREKDRRTSINSRISTRLMAIPGQPGQPEPECLHSGY